MVEEPKIATRQRTFLKGTLYYDNRRGSIECVVRDMSDSGARLTFDHPANVPDNVELFIPNKNQTLRARVQRRGVVVADMRPSAIAQPPRTAGSHFSTLIIEKPPNTGI